MVLLAGGGGVAAEPARLRTYADRTHDARALVDGPALRAALDRLRSSRSEGIGPLRADHATTVWLRRTGDTDTLPYDVADGLEAADRGSWAVEPHPRARDRAWGLAARLRHLTALGDVAAVARFGAALDADERRALTAGYPELVGPADGLPHTMRYRANATLVERALERQRATVVAARLGGVPPGFLAELEHRLDVLEALAGPAHDPATCSRPPRQLLAFSGQGDGRVVEVFGDLSAADHVTVFVPGITNTLDNALSQTIDVSGRIHAEATVAAAGRSVATIAWLGYDTPGLLDAPLAGRAHHAADQLRAFVDGLDLPASASRTVVGHSYGSLVTGIALADGLEVDNAVLAGSPGTGVDHVDDLRTEAAVYALRAPDDVVSLSEWHGADPADHRFGATPLATGHGADGERITGHSGYFDAGSDALRNIGLVAVGRGADADHVEPGWLDRALAWLDRTAGDVPPVEDAIEGVDTTRDIGRDLFDRAHDWVRR